MTVIIGMSGNKLRTPEVTFTSLVPTTITFSWPSVLHATSYEYYTSAVGGGSATVPLGTLTGDATTKNITVSGGNVNLTFYIRALGDVIYEKSEYGFIQGLSTKGTLPNPVSLAGSSTTTTAVTFNWTAGTPAPFDANWSYSYYTIINGVTSSTTTGYTNTSKVITVPNIGDTAAFYLTAVGTNYISSTTMTATKAAYGYLQAPAAITPQAVSTTSVQFTWTNPTTPAVPLSYDYYTVSAGVTSATSNVTATATTTSITITVANAGNATIYVKSVGLPYAPSTTWASVYGTAYLGYGSVSNITGLHYSVTQVSFTWTGQNTNSYSYYTSLSGSAASPIGTVTDASRPLIISTGAANTAVTLYLKPTGNSSYMPATSYSSGSGTSYAGIASTSALSKVEDTTTTVKFSWSNEANVASYSYHTNLDTAGGTLPAGTTYKIVNSSGIGGNVTFFLSATGTNNWMDMPEKSLQGSSYGYWATPVLSSQPTTSTTFTVSWNPVAGAIYQYTGNGVTTKTNTTTTSGQSILVTTVGGNAAITIYANGGVYAESSATITGSAYIGNSSISVPTVASRSPVSVGFSWTGSYISKYFYSTASSTGPWTDNGTATTATISTTANTTVTIYVQGTANANYTPPTTTTASGTTKLGYSSVSSFSGSASGFYTVTFSWTGVHSSSFQYYTNLAPTVQTTPNTSVDVSNGGNAGGGVTFYVLPLTNDLTNYDTPLSYTSSTGYGTTPDTTPNAFSFTTPSAVALSSSNTSNTVTLAGMDAGFVTSVSVSSGGTLYYSTDGITFNNTSSSASISTSNKYIYVTTTASGNYTTAKEVTVTYGGTVGTYTVTTIAATPTPNPFTFPDVTGVGLNDYFNSTEIVLSGFVNNAGNIPVYGSLSTTTFSAEPTTGGTTYRLGATSTSPYLATASADGKLYLKARIYSSNSYATSVTNTIYVGTGSGTFTLTTQVQPVQSVSISFSLIGITSARVTVATTGGTATSYTLKAYNSSYTTQTTLNYSTGLPIGSQPGNVFDIQTSSNTGYYIKGFASNAAGETVSSGNSFTSLTTPPTGVTLTVSPGVTDVSATLVVAASGGGTPTSYSIEQYSGVTYSGTPTVTGPQSSSTFVLTGLNSYTSYYYKGVAITNGGSTKSPGATPTFTTLTAATAPTAPAISSIDATGVVFFTAPTSAGTAIGGAAATISSYTIKVYNSSGTVVSTTTAQPQSSSKPIPIPSDIGYASYTTSMTATNSAGITSSASNVVSPGTCGALTAAGTRTTTTFDFNIGNPTPTTSAGNGYAMFLNPGYRITLSDSVSGTAAYQTFTVGSTYTMSLASSPAGASLTSSVVRYTVMGPTPAVSGPTVGTYPTAPSITFTDSTLYTQYTATISSPQSTLYYATSSTATQPAFGSFTSATSPAYASAGTQTAGTKLYWWAVVLSSNGLYSTYTSVSHTAVAPATPSAPWAGISSSAVATFIVAVSIGEAVTGYGYRWKKGLGGTYSAWIQQSSSGTFPAVTSTAGANIYIQAVVYRNGYQIISTATSVNKVIS